MAATIAINLRQSFSLCQQPQTRPVIPNLHPIPFRLLTATFRVQFMFFFLKKKAVPFWFLNFISAPERFDSKSIHFSSQHDTSFFVPKSFEPVSLCSPVFPPILIDRVPSDRRETFVNTVKTHAHVRSHIYTTLARWWCAANSCGCKTSHVCCCNMQLY